MTATETVMTESIGVPLHCPECNAIRGHSPTCSRMCGETAKRELIQLHKDCWKRQSEFLNTLRRHREQIVFWQGKHAMLRHENNKLRRKLYRKETKQ